MAEFLAIAATAYHHAIEAFLTFTGMSDSTAHVQVGLAIYVTAQLVVRDRRGSTHALKAVMLLEFANECMDYLFSGSWNLPDTTSDVIYTMLWPTILMLSAKYRRHQYARRVARLELAVQTNPLHEMQLRRA